MRWKRLGTGIKLLLLATLFIVIASPEWPAFAGERHGLDRLVQMQQFDFVAWELKALSAKLTGELAAGHDFLDEEAGKQFVLSYLDLMRQIHALEREVEGIFADADVVDPEAATNDLRDSISSMRAELTRRQPLAEAILQAQVGAILAEEGFEFLDMTWPPVEMHITPLPQILIVSPREEIRQIHNVPLEAGLDTSAKEELEEQVFSDLDRSALVVSIGGLGLFPAMIVESSSINFLADVVAHEWAHHWLTLRPVGIGYAASPEMRTINETVASIIGEEIGAKVVARFYPEFVPPPADTQEMPQTEEQAPVFDFRQEMAETRVRVDQLLAEGKVIEAEAYMNDRQRVFQENGYGNRVRKLNQAYFAFYGAYADTPGETGGDPVGPAVITLREQSVSLREFMDNVAFVTSFAALERLLEESSLP